jgi:hypothetical protein
MKIRKQAPARHDDPETSHEAADLFQEAREKQFFQLLDQYYIAGRRGLIAEQASIDAGLIDAGSPWTRSSELQRSGCIEVRFKRNGEPLKRLSTKHGSQQVRRITDFGRAVAEGREEIVVNSAKDKGDHGERDVRDILRELTGRSQVDRELGAGRREDVGDIHGMPLVCIQVGRRRSIAVAIREKGPAESERQRRNKRVPFAASFLRADRGQWSVIMSPAQWVKLWRYAVIGWRWTHEYQGADLDPCRPAARMKLRGQQLRPTDDRSAHRPRGRTA